MRAALLVAAALFTLSSGVAFAEGEGNGDPFPYRAPGTVTVLKGHKALPAKGQDPFPFRGNDTVVAEPWSQAVLPSYGSEGAVQTANSLPAGFSAGTPAFQRDAVLKAYAQAQTAKRAAILMAQQAATQSNKG